MRVYRTPDERFDGLPGLSRSVHYTEWEDLRLAAVDEGTGPTVVLLHGEPSWSYLYRKTIGTLVAGGYRCVAPDLPGFGRSDKPLDDSWYSYERHAEAVAAILDDLGLRDVTLVMHDWGGPIGLRVATMLRPERVGRMVAMDTGLLTGLQDMGEAWHGFRDIVRARPDLPIAKMIRLGCRTAVDREVLAAYAAPYPDAVSKAGARAFPRLVPLTPDAPGADVGREILARLREDERPALLLWAQFDPLFPLDPFGREMHEQFGGRGELEVVDGAGHFLPEDRGEHVGTRIAAWLAGVLADRPAQVPA